MAVYINKNILRFLFSSLFFPCLLWNEIKWNEIIISIKTNTSINVTFIIIIIHIRNHLVKMRLFALPSQQLLIHLKLFYFLFRHIILYHWFARFWCIQVAQSRFWYRWKRCDYISSRVAFLLLLASLFKFPKFNRKSINFIWESVYSRSYMIF